MVNDAHSRKRSEALPVMAMILWHVYAARPMMTVFDYVEVAWVSGLGKRNPNRVAPSSGRQLQVGSVGGY